MSFAILWGFRLLQRWGWSLSLISFKENAGTGVIMTDRLVLFKFGFHALLVYSLVILEYSRWVALAGSPNFVEIFGVLVGGQS